MPVVMQHHLTELLAEREGIGVSRSTVRRILQEEGITSPRTHRVATHRSRRERYPKEGMLVHRIIPLRGCKAVARLGYLNECRIAGL